MTTDAVHEDYEAAEREFLQAIRDQRDWADLRLRAAELAEKARVWNGAEHAAWREATDENSRGSLAVSTDATEMLEAVWRDVALAFEGKPATGY
ncbi:hypothetical protein ACSMXN_07335 [Jatrophihabitans sp. DSM 45814]